MGNFTSNISDDFNNYEFEGDHRNEILGCAVHTETTRCYHQSPIEVSLRTVGKKKTADFV